MQPTVQHPKTSADYRNIDFEVLARDVHPIDQIEFHKQKRLILKITEDFNQ